MVIAGTYEQAARIAQRRGHGERIIGLMGKAFLTGLRGWLTLVVRYKFAATRRAH